MKRIDLQIQVLSPLAIAKQKHGGGFTETENYIPGSVIRGAIASYILRHSDNPSANFAENGGDFQAIFLGENPAIFQNAYPAIIEGRTEPQSEVRVLPATALSSKTKPGFKAKRNNGVFDTLIDRFCAECYGRLYDPNCPSDNQGRVDAYTGFYSQIDRKYYSHSASTRLLTRAGINRRRTTSEEEILYNIEVLNESQEKKQKPVVYTGAIIVADELADILQKIINNHQEDLHLGSSTSRGLGKVKITAKSPIDTKLKVVERINQFNNKLRKRWDDWKVFGNPLEDLPKDRTFFTLDLQANAILMENWRRTTVISPAMLQQFVNVNDSSLELHVAYSSYEYRSGWNAAWGLMKDVELITNKGGVYLFSTNKKDLWIKTLEELELKGVGDRTCEGFGQVQICNEFHLVFQENPV
jgi:CRISPR-associated protein Csx10